MNVEGWDSVSSTGVEWGSVTSDGTVVADNHTATAQHSCDLDALRAEVEALREAAEAKATPILDVPDLDHEVAHLGGQYTAYATVLDLIDKHAREGQ